MMKTIKELGPKEAEFISMMASKGRLFFTIHEAATYWRSRKRAREKLSHLVKKGWLERIERGQYIVLPLEAGPERKWSENPYIIASLLAKPAVIAYWSAIRFWNWTEQMPRVVYVQTTQRKNTPQKTIMGMEYQIVTVNKEKMYGISKQWARGHAYWVTEKEKTLIDSADAIKKSGGIEELIKAVKNAAPEINYPLLDRYAMQFPNGTVRKRLGFLFETFAPVLPRVAKQTLDRWQQTGLPEGISPLLPDGPKTGSIIKRWRVRVNVEV